MTFVRENHFVPVVDAIRVEIIRVEECQVDVLSVGAFFRYSLQRERSSELRYSHRLLSPSRNGAGLFGATSSHSHPDEHDPLFCLVSQTACSIKPCGARNPFDHRFLSPTNDGEPQPLFQFGGSFSPLVCEVGIGQFLYADASTGESLIRVTGRFLLSTALSKARLRTVFSQEVTGRVWLKIRRC
jgi:hypothetical protein